MSITNEEAQRVRAERLKDDPKLNGFEMVAVSLKPETLPTYAEMTVYFLNENELGTIWDDAHPTNPDDAVDPADIFAITGGHRIKAGTGSGKVHVSDILSRADNTITLKVEPLGDYSTYTLEIDTDSYPEFDPIFSKLEFKFRPGCFNINCAPEWDPAPEPLDEPVIDYLAKDFDTFRHTLITAMMERVPNWEATSEVDLDQVLISLFSAAADELSDYQDRVMNEAYLASARKRVTLARLALLMDYHIHQGNQASTWLAATVSNAESLEPPLLFQVWSGNETLDSGSIVFMSRERAPDQYIFTNDLQPADAFSGGTATSALRDAFALKGISLSASTAVTEGTAPASEDTSLNWTLEDQDSQLIYYIRKSKKKLKVYGPALLHHLFNKMSLYTWSDAVPALDEDSTQADLRIALHMVDDSGTADSLDSGNVSSQLRGTIEDAGFTLSADASLTVTTEESGLRWRIDDTPESRAYLVVKETGGELAIHVLDDDTLAMIVRDAIRGAQLRHLAIQELLNPSTGGIAGRKIEKRQLLRLKHGKSAAEVIHDPVTGEYCVRAHWETKDKLKEKYCFTVDCGGTKVENVSLFYGNLFEVFHGSLQEITFKDPGEILGGTDERHYLRTERLGTLCSLPEGPLAYKETTPGGEDPPRSTLTVEVINPFDSSRETYSEVSSLIHSRSDDAHFIVETDEEMNSTIRFGNGINGKELPEGFEVECSYQAGYGPDGNVGADSLVNFTSVVSVPIEECWNPFPVTNGLAPEPVAEIIRRVPEAFKYKQLRAINIADYEDRAEEVDGVQQAAARYVWTGSWRAVRVVIDPEGTTELSADLSKKVSDHLETVRLLGEDIEIRPPRYVPLKIEVTVCIHPDYWPQDVRYVLEQEFSDGYTPDGRKGFFHPDLWTFGQPLRASQLVGRIQKIPGIDHVLELDMRRWNEAQTGDSEERKSKIDVRSEEIILVENDPDHMERGMIDFVLEGGRR